MKKPVIFVLSFTSIIRRGRQTLALQQAGVFRLFEKQAICTRRDASVMGVSTRAERLVFDSGRGKSLFVCPENCQTPQYAHRNHAELCVAPAHFLPILCEKKPAFTEAKSASEPGAFSAFLRPFFRDLITFFSVKKCNSNRTEGPLYVYANGGIF